ncbi:hypothetical protein A2V49_02535 [candidate division WWE3 bacterium RBG_19FT_COMBO_34_6]|uniref:DNA-directed DNA polymerase n=1 Tax=candidate division WWE3 bacterium RBG_19FT_COMBO_34_6 TaxID=1802612 RepID=A0A1F4ULW2_UNCKA|nr:MAG: hypothetical protein A2V49_02535 [candidate division WWE3 bacterium RBG_19FT_COMBO_34_6]
MIYIIHGNDYSKSREQVISLYNKTKSSQKIELKGSDIDQKTLSGAVFGVDIFGETPFLVLDISDLKNQAITEFLPILKKTPENITLIILHNKEIGKTNEFLKNAQLLKANVILNNKFIKSNVFRFVDFLFSKDRNSTYRELGFLQDESADSFYIFSMIIYGLRNVTNAKFQTSAFKEKSDFVRMRSIKQAALFSKENILNLYGILYDTDLKIKTGKIPPDIMLSYTIEKIINL